MAKRLVGHIKRKVIKQTVMTSVYGVTFIGARMQIHKQLEDLHGVEWAENKEDCMYQASVYLARLTLQIDLVRLQRGQEHHVVALGVCPPHRPQAPAGLLGQSFRPAHHATVPQDELIQGEDRDAASRGG